MSILRRVLILHLHLLFAESQLHKVYPSVEWTDLNPM